MTDPYSLDRVTETAQRMIGRYSSPRVAGEMADYHARDFKPTEPGYGYWLAVRREIDRLTQTRKR